MRYSRKSRRSTSGALLAGLVLILAGAASGYLLRPVAAPPALPETSRLVSAPVGVEAFSDERTVQISFQTSPTPSLVVGMGGRVTANTCKAGRPLKSGEIVARIGSTPIIALATHLPLYRDLRLDTEGDDVMALQGELSRLGYTVQVDGVFGEQTKAAAQELQESLGISSPRGVVYHKRILWLPGRSPIPESCDLVRGEYVAARQPYAKVSDQPTAIAAESIPQDAVDGVRTMTVLGVTGLMTERGVAKDPEFIRRVTATRAYQRAQNVEALSELTATIALKEPLETMKVPPGALFDVAGKRACVQSGKTSIPVKIVGSKLGVSLVLPKGKTPKRVNLGPAITQTSCGDDD